MAAKHCSPHRVLPELTSLGDFQGDLQHNKGLEHCVIGESDHLRGVVWGPTYGTGS